MIVAALAGFVIGCIVGLAAGVSLCAAVLAMETPLRGDEEQGVAQT